MSLKQSIDDRLKQLEWSVYRLSQEIAKLRGEPDSTQRIYSSIRNCVNNPNSCRWETLQDVLIALDGKLSIRWNNPEDVEL